MRKDIKINTQTGDFELGDMNDKMIVCEFELLGQIEDDIAGRIIVPDVFDIGKIYNEGVIAEIPYIPAFKNLRLQIGQRYSSNGFRPITSRTARQDWFYVYANVYEKHKMQMKASQLLMLGEDRYLLKIENENDGIGDRINIWSAVHTDFSVDEANIQNRNLLLKCVPTNSYRYPNVGIGLIRYLNANIEQTNLAQVIQSQFESDKVRVISANFDPVSGNLDLNLDFTEANENV